jgi:hypothetical protein
MKNPLYPGKGYYTDSLKSIWDMPRKKGDGSIFMTILINIGNI